MHFSNLRLRCFRNIAAAELEFSPKLNLFVGRNGQGKTSALEALYVVAGFRSFRATRAAELMQHGEPAAHLRTDVNLGGLQRRVQLRIEGSSREFEVDGKAAKATGEWLASMVMVAFSPDDLFLVKGEPERRRRWLDRIAFFTHRDYLANLTHYGRALKARSALVRDGLYGRDQLLLDTYDEQLARYGAAVSRARAEALEKMSAFFALHVAGLTDRKKVGELKYESDVHGCDAQLYLQKLVDRRAHDLQRKLTGTGVHRDDVDVSLDGKAARRFASQGEQRVLTLALKLAEMSLLHAASGVAPVLLLDDVAGELDRERQALLLRQLMQHAGQVFVAVTEEPGGLADSETERRRYNVSEGSFELA